MSWFKLYFFWIKAADIKTNILGHILLHMYSWQRQKYQEISQRYNKACSVFGKNFDDTRVELWVIEGCVRAFADAVFLLHMQGCD